MLLRLAAFFALLLLAPPVTAGDLPCEPGTFSDSGFEPCTPCPAGSYSDSPGAAACTACPPGSVSGFPGAAGCDPCLPGSAQPAAGAASCELCPAGSYGDAFGAAACTACPAGSAGTAIGATACEPCPTGFAQPTAGSTSCDVCPAGSFAAGPGNAACAACPRNSHAPGSGASACVSCPCDDGIPCTRDTCDPVSGACTAPPTAGCTVATVTFTGSVTARDPGLAACFDLGDPIAGSWQVDPEAPDAEGGDPSRGEYGITSFALRVGPPGAARIEIGAGFGSFLVVDEPSFEQVEIDVLPEQVTPTACGEPFAVFLQLFDGGDATLAGDALPAYGWQLAAFPDAAAFLELPGTPVPVRVEATDIVFSPEPGAAGAGLAAAATLLLGARARRRRGPVR